MRSKQNPVQGDVVRGDPDGFRGHKVPWHYRILGVRGGFLRCAQVIVRAGRVAGGQLQKVSTGRVWDPYQEEYSPHVWVRICVAVGLGNLPCRFLCLVFF